MNYACVENFVDEIWDKEKLVFLKEHYEDKKYPVILIGEALGVSGRNVTKKANQLGMRRNKAYKINEVKFILDNYPFNRAKDIARAIGVTENSVRKIAYTHGVKRIFKKEDKAKEEVMLKTKNKRYTKEQESFIRNNCETHNIKYISDMLNSSSDAIRAKLKHMGIKEFCRENSSGGMFFNYCNETEKFYKMEYARMLKKILPKQEKKKKTESYVKRRYHKYTKEENHIIRINCETKPADKIAKILNMDKELIRLKINKMKVKDFCRICSWFPHYSSNAIVFEYCNETEKFYKIQYAKLLRKLFITNRGR